MFQVPTPCPHANYAAFARKDVIMIIITNTTGVKYLDTNNIYTNLRASNWKYTAQAPRVLGFRKLNEEASCHFTRDKRISSGEVCG